MSEVSKIHRCETPRCMESIEKYGEQYHMVYDRMNSTWVPEGLIAKCSRCGGVMREEGVWEHKCKKCGKDVEPGELIGLFVPHVCHVCENKVVETEIKIGNVCRMCRQPWSRCCC